MGTNGLRRHARDGHRITAASVFCLLAAGWLATDITGADLTRIYEDDRIRVPLPAGWTAKQETLTFTGDQTLIVPIGGVLSYGKYRLYLLTHDGQVSGIIGGRFGEIAQYVAPWMPIHDPWGCFGDFATRVTPVTQ